jgi:hypothetical protein
MRQSRAMEFATGLFVLLGIFAIFFLVTQTTGMRGFGTENITLSTDAGLKGVAEARQIRSVRLGREGGAVMRAVVQTGYGKPSEVLEVRELRPSVGWRFPGIGPGSSGVGPSRCLARCHGDRRACCA